MSKLYIVRHGQTDWNVKKLLQGATDIELNGEGIKQAEELSNKFGDYEGKPINFDLIVPQWDYKLNDSSHNIESIQDCLLRAKKFIDKVKKEYPNKTVLIISHGSFIKALHFNLIGYDENTDFLSFNPKNSVLYEYEID